MKRITCPSVDFQGSPFLVRIAVLALVIICVVLFSCVNWFSSASNAAPSTLVVNQQLCNTETRLAETIEKPIAPLPTQAAVPPVSSAHVDTKCEVKPSHGHRFLTGPEVASRLYTPAGQAHLSVLDLDPKRLAPLTHETQQMLYSIQV